MNMKCILGHQWEEVNKEHLVKINPPSYLFPNYPIDQTPHPVTVISYRCKRCQEYKQKIVDGHLKL